MRVARTESGTDALKAMAQGSQAVAIGKFQVWGMAAGGQAGVVRVLELLEEEIAIDMALLGVADLDHLSAEYICKAGPVTSPHEMSA